MIIAVKAVYYPGVFNHAIARAEEVKRDSILRNLNECEF